MRLDLCEYLCEMNMIIGAGLIGRPKGREMPGNFNVTRKCILDGVVDSGRITLRAFLFTCCCVCTGASVSTMQIRSQSGEYKKTCASAGGGGPDHLWQTLGPHHIHNSNW